MRYKTKIKIKYFLKRNLKRLFRFIIYFGLLCSFTVNCFAQEDYQYKYSQLVSNGWTDVYTIYNDGNIERLYQSADSESFDFDIKTSNSFYGVRFNINGSDFLNRSFEPGYLFTFNGSIRADVNADLVSDFISNCSINLNYLDKNGNQKTILFDHNYFELLLTSSFDWGTQYFLNFDISNYSFVDVGTVNSLDFNFDNVATSTFGAVFQFQQVAVGGLDVDPYYTFYLGSKENAPTFLAPDDSSFNDFSSSEEDLLNDTNADEELNTIFHGFESAIESLDVGFTLLREMISPILNWPPFSTVLYISLCIGIFALLLNVANSFRRG